MMKKILDQLEQHVQWLALGLGVLWVLYVAYAFLIDPPLKVQIGTGPALTPGDVDAYVWDNGGAELEDKLKAKAVPTFEAPNLLTQFGDAVGNAGVAPQPLALAALLPTGTNDKIQALSVNANPKAAANPGATIDSLPDLVAAKIDGFREGMSSTMPPANPANQGAVVAGPTDKTWVTVRADIDVTALSNAFAAAKIPSPGPISETTILQIVLQRQEKMPDGSWGNDTVVPPLKINNVQAYPEPAASMNEFWTYLQWANAHPVDIAQPTFYAVVKGDLWAVPGMPLPNANATPAAAFEASKYVTMTPAQLNAVVPPLTSEQKRLINAAKAKLKTPPRAAAPARSAPGRPGPAEGEGGASRAPNDSGRPAAVGAGPRGQNSPDLPIAPPVGEGDAGGGPPPPQVAAAPEMPLPTGSFDPKVWLTAHAAAPTIAVWAHDETAEPGHTYHYRIIYKIKNPIFGSGNVAKDVELAKRLALVSPPSEWTADVEILPTINFWLARNPRSANGPVDVQVFRWQGGETKSKQFTISPGDSIGLKEGDLDFGTGWTLVDIMSDPRTLGAYVLVMDPSGVIHRRDYANDSIDPRYKSWRDQAAAAVTAAAAAPGGGGEAVAASQPPR